MVQVQINVVSISDMSRYTKSVIGISSLLTFVLIIYIYSHRAAISLMSLQPIRQNSGDDDLGNIINHLRDLLKSDKSEDIKTLLVDTLHDKANVDMVGKAVDKTDQVIQDNKTEQIIQYNKTEQVLQDNKTEQVIKDDKTEHILQDNKMEHFTKDDKTEHLLQDDKTEHLIKDDKTENVIKDDKTENVIQDDKTENVIQDNKTENVIQDDKTEHFLQDDKVEHVLQDDKKEHVIHYQKDEADNLALKLVNPDVDTNTEYEKDEDKEPVAGNGSRNAIVDVVQSKLVDSMYEKETPEKMNQTDTKVQLPVCPEIPPHLGKTCLVYRPYLSKTFCLVPYL